MRRIFKVSASLARIRLDSSPRTVSTVDSIFSRLMGSVSTVIGCAGYPQTKTRGLLAYGWSVLRFEVGEIRQDLDRCVATMVQCIRSIESRSR